VWNIELMKLEIRENKVVWVKQDGSTSIKPVGAIDILDTSGFFISSIISSKTGLHKGESVEILSGSPPKDNLVLVAKMKDKKIDMAYLVAKGRKDVFYVIIEDYQERKDASKIVGFHSEPVVLLKLRFPPNKIRNVDVEIEGLRKERMKIYMDFENRIQTIERERSRKERK